MLEDSHVKKEGNKILIGKKGKLAWEYLAITILGLAVLILLIIFSTGVKDRILKLVTDFFKNFLGV